MSYDYRNRSYKYQNPESPQVLKSPHPDYNKNLEIANNFVQKVQKSISKSMSVKVCDSEHLQKSLLTVSWKPPKEYYGSTFATSIFLHDSTINVNKNIENVFNSYFRKAKEVENRNAQQPTLFEPGLNNVCQKV